MTGSPKYAKHENVEYVWVVCLVLVIILGVAVLSSLSSGEKLTGQEIPAGPCTAVTADGVSTGEELLRQAVAELAPNSPPTAGEPTNMREAAVAAHGSDLLRAGTTVSACLKFGDPHTVASVGVNHDPINLGGK